MILSTEYNVALYPHKSLVVFDEIQRFPKARQSIKRLVADGRFDYIETGVFDLDSVKTSRTFRYRPKSANSRCTLWILRNFVWRSARTECSNIYAIGSKRENPLEEGLHHKAIVVVQAIHACRRHAKGRGEVLVERQEFRGGGQRKEGHTCSLSRRYRQGGYGVSLQGLSVFRSDTGVFVSARKKSKVVQS